MNKVLHKRAGIVFSLILFYGRNKFSVIIIPGIPPVIIFDTKACNPVIAVLESHGCVAPHREGVGFGGVVHCREMSPNQPRFRKGGYGVTATAEAPCLDSSNRFYFA